MKGYKHLPHVHIWRAADLTLCPLNQRLLKQRLLELKQVCDLSPAAQVIHGRKEINFNVSARHLTGTNPGLRQLVWPPLFMCLSSVHSLFCRSLSLSLLLQQVINSPLSFYCLHFSLFTSFTFSKKLYQSSFLPSVSLQSCLFSPLLFLIHNHLSVSPSILSVWPSTLSFFKYVCFFLLLGCELCGHRQRRNMVWVQLSCSLLWNQANIILYLLPIEDLKGYQIMLGWSSKRRQAWCYPEAQNFRFISQLQTDETIYLCFRLHRKVDMKILQFRSLVLLMETLKFCIQFFMMRFEDCRSIIFAPYMPHTYLKTQYKS